jgi:hypothetical protein
MKSITGRYSKKNRFQIFVALFFFSFFAWWGLHPLNFHLLDGISLMIVTTIGQVIEMNVPFYFIQGWPEIIFLIFTTLIPVFLSYYFYKSESYFMTSLTLFYWAYVLQNWFRFFHFLIFRIPAMIFLCLSLLTLFIGLISCIKYSENEGFDNCNEILGETDQKTMKYGRKPDEKM